MSINTVVFINSDTYNPSPGVTAIKFILTGAGGGGGAAEGNGAGQAASACCGAGGGTGILVTTDIAAEYTITIGTGGTGGSTPSGNGSIGNDSTIQEVAGPLTFTANGGAGGLGMGATSGYNSRVPSIGGTSSDADVNINGGNGSPGIVSGGLVVMASMGGGTFWSSGPGVELFQNLQEIPLIPGAGGQGGAVFDDLNDYPGVTGANGICYIEEYTFT